MTDRSEWPQWLRDAETSDALVSIEDGRVVWHGGVWRGGDWRGGEWHDGEWHDGEWHDGVWHDGEWNGGVWRGGVWRGGVWRGGVWRGGIWLGGVWRGGEWRGGEWRGGIWHGGVWRGIEDRLLYHAALIGIVFDARGEGRAYRTTTATGEGRYSTGWIQPEGEYYEEGLLPAGSGTCMRGIHVTTAARAHTYFRVDPSAQYWEVTFRREDLLDCDGEKARIRGGVFRRIPCPFGPMERRA